MKNILIYLILLFSYNTLLSQTIIAMEEKNGVYYIPCKVNGINMNFVLDSGASNVTISMTEAQFLIKQGLLNETDFIDTTNYQLADGSIIEGTRINLSNIEIGGKILNNVQASIVHNQTSPLLLGLSAIKKLGPIEIAGNKLIIQDGLTDNYTELHETFEWIFDRINMWAYAGNGYRIKYFIHLQKNKTGGGYSLIGFRYNYVNENKTEHMFALRISQIEKMDFSFDENNPDILLLNIYARNNERFFVVDNESVSSKYSFILKSSLNSENMTERFTKAFANLIETNQKLNIEKF